MRESSEIDPQSDSVITYSQDEMIEALVVDAL